MNRYDLDRDSGPDPSIEWRDIPGLPGYRIDCTGTVWSSIHLQSKSKQWKALTQFKTKQGYMQIVLRRNGKSARFFVHRLVLTTFHGPCPEGMESRHLDGNSLNNHRDNLCWGTHLENIADKKRHGTMLDISDLARRTLAKLSMSDVRTIKQKLSEGVYGTELARQYGVTNATIYQIKDGKTWKDVI
jgi:hypothetical protein